MHLPRVNDAITTIMKKVKKKTSFMIIDRRPRAPAAPDRERPGFRGPTAQEVREYAIALAREDEKLKPYMKPMLDLFHWPAWASPCADPRKLVLPIVQKFMKQAEEELRSHYEYYYDLEVRRKRWLRAHPRPRGWVWTRRPLKQAIPPPRRRDFLPPMVAYPDRGSPPPPPVPDGSPKRPGWRERERLLCFSWLFGNKRVVEYDAPGALYPVAQKNRLFDLVTRMRDSGCKFIDSEHYNVTSLFD